MTKHQVNQKTAARSFTTTKPLTIKTHPDDPLAWPAWAVIAMVHMLHGSNDMYVSFASCADMLATTHDRAHLCGVSVEVCRLYYWDWGPVEVDVSDSFTAETDEVFQTAGRLEEVAG